MVTTFIYSTNVTRWWYTAHMKRASISLPDDLAKALDNYIQAQEVRPAVTTVMQAALREYLGPRGFLQERRASKTSKRTARSQS
jgi:metal-responsive CopG/Arc/MetJ family transcriptional regulator